MATTTGFGQIPDLRCKTLSSFGRIVMDKYGNIDVPNVSVDTELSVGIGGNVIFPATSINFRNSTMDFTGASIVGFTGNIQGNYTIDELFVTSNITTNSVFAKSFYGDVYGNLITSTTVSANIITNYITIPNGEITIDANIYTDTFGKHTGPSFGVHYGDIHESSPGADIEVVGTLLGNLTGDTVCVNGNLYTSTIIGKNLPDRRIDILGNTTMGNVLIQTLTVLGNFTGTITGTLEGPVITNSIETDGTANVSVIEIGYNPGTTVATVFLKAIEFFAEQIELDSLVDQQVVFSDNNLLSGSPNFLFDTANAILNVTNIVASNITSSSTPVSGQILYTGLSGLLSAESGFEYDDSLNLLTVSRIKSTNIPTQRAVFTTTDGELTNQVGYEFDGSNLTVPSLKDSALTSGQIVYAGTDGLLKTEVGFEYNESINTITVERITSTATTNQITLGTTNTTTINAIAPSVSRIYTIPDVNSNANFVLNTNQPLKITNPTSVNQALISTATSGEAQWGLLSLTSGITGTLPIANGGTNSSTALSNGTLMISSGGAIVEGTSSTTPTFTSETLTAISNQLTLGSINTTTLTSVAPASSRIYTIPDVGANANFVFDTNQSLKITNATTTDRALISTASSGEAQWGLLNLTTAVSGTLPIANGGTNSSTALSNGTLMVSSGGSIVEGTSSSSPTFTSESLTATSNQITLGTTNTTTLSATAPASSIVYTFPDIGTNANIVLDTIQPLKITNSTVSTYSLISTASSGEAQWSQLSLTSGVTGVLPIANGGTNSSSALSNGTIMVSSGGAIVEGTSSSTPTFTSETLTATLNQIILGSASTITLSAPTPASSRIYSLADAGSNANIVLNTNQPLKISNATTVNQALISTAISGEAQWGQLSLTSGVTGTLPIANGGTNSSSALLNGTIMVSSGGAIVEGTSSTTPTFTSESLTATSNQITFGSTNTTVLSALAPSAPRIYTLPDAGANASIVLNTNQPLKITNATTINYALISNASGESQWSQLSLSAGVTGVLPVANGGTNSSTVLSNGTLMISSGGSIVEGTSSTTPTFTSENLTSVTNQLTLGTTNTTTINATAPVASRVYTLADVGGNANFVMDTNQPLNIINASSNGKALVGTATPGEAQWDFLSLGSAISGTLPIANGGTNSSTVLGNDRLMVSSGGAIVEGTSSTSPSFDEMTVSTMTVSTTLTVSSIPDTQVVFSNSGSLEGDGHVTFESNIFTTPAMTVKSLKSDAMPTIVYSNDNGDLLIDDSFTFASSTLTLPSGGAYAIAGLTILDSNLGSENVLVSSGSKVSTISNFTFASASNKLSLPSGGSYNIGNNVILDGGLGNDNVLVSNGSKVSTIPYFTFASSILSLPSGGSYNIGNNVILDGTLQDTLVLHGGPYGLVTNTAGFTFSGDLLTAPRLKASNLSTAAEVLYTLADGELTTNSAFTFDASGLNIPITTSYQINGNVILNGGLTEERVLHAGVNGMVTDTAGFTFAAGVLSVPTSISTNTIKLLAAGTDGEIIYTGTGSELSTNASFNFDGTNLDIPTGGVYKIGNATILGPSVQGQVTYGGVSGLYTSSSGFTFTGTNTLDVPLQYNVNGTQVVTMRQGAIFNPSNATITTLTPTIGTSDAILTSIGDTMTVNQGPNINNNFEDCRVEINNLITVVNSLRTQLNAVLIALRTHGLIAPEFM